MNSAGSEFPARRWKADPVVAVVDPSAPRRAAAVRCLDDASIASWTAVGIDFALSHDRLVFSRVFVLAAESGASSFISMVDRLRARAPAARFLAVIDETSAGSLRRDGMRFAAAVDDVVRATCMREELALRVLALGSRAQIGSCPSAYTIGPDLVLDVSGLRLIHRERDIDLTPREFRLFAALARASGTIIRRAELVRLAGWDAANESRAGNALEAGMTQLRKKLARIGLAHRIQTARGRGYRFVGHAGLIAAPVADRGPEAR
ncbi:MAG TPA: winged helix-turn-helix domain-containing protein [Gemmatimonadaceae bacterium]|nr:winged helix-turn-helix domain-containing protein [Gemmatimonadaceae bacterium]